MSNIWERTNYKSNIEYLIDTNIREFDISKANISILRDANIISEAEYNYFLHSPRMERQIAIGKLQGQDTNITNILKLGIANARRLFIENNGINDSEILFIRNDAIAVIGNKNIQYLDISDRVKFRENAKYTSYYRHKAIDLFYFYDPVTNIENLDVKGLGDYGVQIHKNYMLEFLSELFYSMQMDGIKTAIQLLQVVHTNYLNMDLDVEFYRELNPRSLFKLHKSVSICSSLYIDNAIEYHKRFLDISYNDELFRHFNKIFASVYFQK